MNNKIVLVLTVIFGGIELLICKFFKKSIVKFILPIIFLVLTLFFILVGTLAPHEGMRDLAYIVIGMLAGISSAISFVVAVVYLLIYDGLSSQVRHFV